MVDTSMYSRRLNFLLIFFVGFLSILILKLFVLQVVRHNYYVETALADRQGLTELNSRRGEIFFNDYNSDEGFRVATNTTLDTVFADPFLIEDPLFIADKLAPILFDEKSALEAEEFRLKEQRKSLPADLTEEEVHSILQPRSVSELELEFRQEMLDKLSQKVRQSIILYNDPEPSVRDSVRALGLPGIEITDRQIFAYPPQISNPKEYAAKMSTILEIEPARLENLFKGNNRYTILAKKIELAKSEQIQDMIDENDEAFKGIGFEPKSYRFYPEHELGSQVLGFVDSTGGTYGVEEYFDDILSGESGVFKTQLDGLGKQITVGGDTVIKPAEDGSDVYLTIERSIQMEVERLLKKRVEDTQADSGQVIVMDPKTGKILAMAHYPTYDPNEFWKALDTEEIFMTPEDKENLIEFNYASGTETYLVTDEDLNKQFQVLPLVSEETGETYYEKFKNNVGAAVYRNRTVVDVYEPGSIFKPLTMSAAIDDESVTPNTTVVDNGPIQVDEFWISNALNKHYGTITMTQVLETSNNVGMAWIAQRIGRNLFHSYMMKYGLGKRTDIEFVGEKSGQIEPFTGWADSELVTHAFGQGITLTPIQMITAFSALANDGVLMEPSIVEKIVHSDGRVDEIDPTIVRRVVSKKTADTLVAMLESVIVNGQARTAKVKGYTVAGKTGTSQTYKHGVPLSGPGTTVASFAGFAPASNPRFVVLIKVDKPRTSPWGADVAAPLFHDIAEYILQYMAIPPDDV